MRVNDHFIVRQGRRAVLDAYPDMELVGEAGNGEEAIQLVDQLDPAVVLMDINMLKMNGIEATKEIMVHHPETSSSRCRRSEILPCPSLPA